MKFTSYSALLCLLAAMPVLAIERQPYFGISAGISRLTPDVEGSGYTLDKDISTVASVTLGVPLTRRLNAELGYSQLGEAALSDSQDIGYTAVSLGAIAYVLGSAERLRYQPGLRAYFRLGLNIMDHQHDIPLTKADSSAIWAGAGLEWPIGEYFRLRGEFASFDGDAQAMTLGLLFQPGARRSRSPATVNEPAADSRPEVQPQPTLESAPATEPAPKPVPEPPIKTAPEPQIIASPQSAPTIVAAPVSGVLNGVEFEVGTAILTTIGMQLVDRLAASLLAYPSLNIEIAAHTDGTKGSAERLALTRNRAIAIARQLAANGVAINRMKARAFGANLPRASGDSAGARRMNNRIEITVR